MIDSGIFNSSNFRNGMQYFVRVDKSFRTTGSTPASSDTTLDYGGPAVIPSSRPRTTTRRAPSR
jgi:hypothetical protein